jgi:hypothetical protein
MLAVTLTVASVTADPHPRSPLFRRNPGGLFARFLRQAACPVDGCVGDAEEGGLAR